MAATRVIRGEEPRQTFTGRVALTVSGFTEAAVAAAFDEMRKREGVNSFDLVEMLIAERARAAGIDVPEVKAEQRRRLANEMEARAAVRRRMQI